MNHDFYFNILNVCACGFSTYGASRALQRLYSWTYRRLCAALSMLEWIKELCPLPASESKENCAPSTFS
ncbi:hypothetical protein ACRRTK_002571 [Alexandromys fortis]